MIPRSKKKVNEPESDSDWDSLPSEIHEPLSSRDHKPAAQQSSHSPNPPDLPNAHGSGKRHGTTKPVNIYKNTLNNSQKAATTFEDKSGGLWNDGDNDGESVKYHHSKELDNNNHGNGSKVSKEKKTKQNIQEQEKKRPPFTDFKDSLSSPIPPSQNKKYTHEVSGVNQAYRVDNGDEMHGTNHDSWDESDNDETKMQQSYSPGNQMEKDIEMKQQHILNRNPDQSKQKSKENNQDKSVSEVVHGGPLVVHHEQHFDVGATGMQFENCCFVQGSHGPFDDRYRPSFFHGSGNHFHVRKDDPKAAVTNIADKSEVIFQRFWREVFGVLQILINFFTIFALELFKVIVHSIRYLISGILYTTGDHLTKPLLAAVFNNIMQPFSILLLNIFTIIKNLLKPVLELTRELCTQISIPLRAFRLFEVNWNHKSNESKNTCTDIKVI